MNIMLHSRAPSPLPAPVISARLSFDDTGNAQLPKRRDSFSTEFRRMLLPVTDGAFDLLLKIFPPQNVKNTVNFAITRQLLSCDTSRYGKWRNKYQLRSEKKMARRPNLYLHTGR